MTAKKKAIELIGRVNKIIGSEQFKSESKEIALLCVKEVVTELNKLPSKDMSDLQFWGEVDHELSLL